MAFSVGSAALLLFVNAFLFIPQILLFFFALSLHLFSVNAIPGGDWRMQTQFYRKKQQQQREECAKKSARPNVIAIEQRQNRQRQKKNLFIGAVFSFVGSCVTFDKFN